MYVCMFLIDVLMDSMYGMDASGVSSLRGDHRKHALDLICIALMKRQTTIMQTMHAQVCK